MAAGVLGAAAPAGAQAGPPAGAQAVSPAGGQAVPSFGNGVVGYRPPVDAPVIDAFRPPAHVGAPGNRGLEYATRPGTAVRAAARGVVVFAGQVGGARHVTVAHPDGVRTSYSFLRTITVRAGQRVGAGHVLGTAGTSLHFGARIGQAYVDPAVLLGTFGRARLVPAAPLGVRWAGGGRASWHPPDRPVRAWRPAALR